MLNSGRESAQITAYVISTKQIRNDLKKSTFREYVAESFERRQNLKFSSIENRVQTTKYMLVVFHHKQTCFRITALGEYFFALEVTKVCF